MMLEAMKPSPGRYSPMSTHCSAELANETVQLRKIDSICVYHIRNNHAIAVLAAVGLQ